MVTTTASKALDINTARSLFAAIYLSVIGASVFIVQPGFVQGLVEYYGFSEQQAGYIASAEIWGLAVVALILAFGGHKYNWQTIMKASVGLFVAGNLGSLLSTDMTLFSALRFVAGLGAGGLVSLTFTIVGLTRDTDRNFAYLIMGVLTYGALGLWAMPLVFSWVGMNGVIVFFAVFGASGWFFVSQLPHSGEEHLQVEEDAVDLQLGFRALAILAMFTYFFAQGVIWAYLFLIGLNGGVDEQGVANGLMLSQFLGIAGALAAAMAASRFGRIIPLAIGILGGAAVLTLLFGQFTAFAYAAIVCAYNFAWNVTHPFLLAAMASFDKHGKVVVYAVAAQMMGLAVGPAFAATLLDGGGYADVVQAGIALFVVSWVLILIPLVKHRMQSRAA